MVPLLAHNVDAAQVGIQSGTGGVRRALHGVQYAPQYAALAPSELQKLLTKSPIPAEQSPSVQAQLKGGRAKPAEQWGGLWGPCGGVHAEKPTRGSGGKRGGFKHQSDPGRRPLQERVQAGG
ncbi:unnamed protein product [Boreogadus saida]